ncbi:MAG TPA: SDR family oxidoreductase [Candidatus Pacearchaeota archaeon]|nr:3-oxoacyl-[acyl-carrier-protein] reductase FabG [archaeon BMS3Abin17]HDK42459.1 SDR family oxidoreductase [Candidatus Pacearchaeota archaeon]HDZ61341.1 SDR family oxidoreductase [Candidatus Pacearchaeota archaeon]
MELKNKVVLITGSSRGIGKEAVKEFTKQGSKIIITYNTNKKDAEKTLQECAKITECMLVKLNVADSSSVSKAVEKIIDKFGSIDVLINNAGIVVIKNLVEQTEKEIEDQINVNLKGLINMTKNILLQMEKQKEGVIINIASVYGKVGEDEVAPYCATKFGVRGFTKAMAKEYCNNKIRFYNVNPSLTATPMTGFQGIPPKKVAEVIVNAAKESLGKDSGGDIDVDDYI